VQQDLRSQTHCLSNKLYQQAALALWSFERLMLRHTHVAQQPLPLPVTPLLLPAGTLHRCTTAQ